MKMIVHSGAMKGIVAVPASKSMMQRACAGALLHRGQTIINNAGDSDDDKAALAIIAQLGASVKKTGNQQLEINSIGVKPISSLINCGESGLSARMFTPIAALSDKPITITGKAALLKRPMDSFEAMFAQLGIEVLYFQNTLPISFKGPIALRNILVDGSLSSQFLTGILFAFACTAQEPYTITVKELISKPYITLTLSVLQNFGVSVAHHNFETFYIEPYQAVKNDIVIDVEGDWSSAAFWLVGAAMNGNITAKGLLANSAQADRKIIEVLSKAGATINQEQDNWHVEKSTLRAFEFDATNCPDLFPILAILATQCEGTSTIIGLGRLIHKESNRIDSIKAMLTSFGVRFSVADNSLIIAGKQILKPCVINSFNDHRIAMAAAIGGTLVKDFVTIIDAHCVAKSYPDFYKILSILGINTQALA